MDIKKLLQVSRDDRQLRDRLDIAGLIARILSGMGTEKEKQQFDEWLQESPEHQKELERIRQEMLTEASEMPDMDEMWKEFKQRLPKKTIAWKFVFRYAALLFLILGSVAWLYYELRPSMLEIPVSVAEQIMPGKPRARLVLADGKEVNITKETNVHIQEEEGVCISTVGNTLQYEHVADVSKDTVLSYNVLTVPAGGEFALQLSDGSKVWLNSGSSLKYPVVFSGNQREVEIEGEGYFEVSRDEQKPFIVRVKDVSVQVLGTAFNISAYDHQTVTTLINGKVRLNKGECEVVLRPGDQAIATSGGEGFQVSQVNARNFTLWKDGIFWFENQDLNVILNELARWYDVEVEYLNPELKDLRFSVEMKRYEDIRTVLQKIEYTRKVRFTIQGRKVYVRK